MATLRETNHRTSRQAAKTRRGKKLIVGSADVALAAASVLSTVPCSWTVVEDCPRGDTWEDAERQGTVQTGAGPCQDTQ